MLIIILVAVSLLVFIIFRFRKVLGLNIIRWIYGKLSYEYLTSYKRIFFRSPFQYCFRDEFVSHVLFILDKDDNLPMYKTYEKISFENQPFFITYKEFLKIKGKPYCFNAFAFNSPSFEIKVLGYKNEISGQKGTAAYYFIDNLFFMGEYIFKETDEKVKENYIRHFLDLKKISGDNFYIENTEERIIHYQDTGFSIDIKYLSRENKRIIETLRAYHEDMTSKTLKVEV